MVPPKPACPPAKVNRGFDAEIWRQADAVLDQLLDLPAEERSRRLEALSLDPEVRSCVASMLEGVGATDLLDRPHPLAPGAATGAGLEGRTLGAWRLGALIGRGGMSSVYRAVRADGAFDTPVAFKLLSAALMGSDWQQRFLEETRVLARLRHPNIAGLLDAGVAEDGTPWLVTELVEGATIERWCDQRDLDTRARVALVLQLCRALAFVQRNLIVHRDIKCQNVMVDAAGQVKLLDFGIARAISAGGEPEPATMTRVFTPDYAAPEQLAGQPVTTATDVFSVGVVLYRLLTNGLPFERSLHGGSSSAPVTPPSKRVATADGIAADERVRRHRLIQGDLDNIVTKALAEAPEERYPHAEALAQDLEAWLEHRPVSARRPSLGYRLGLFIRRRRELAATLAALALITVGGIAATLWQAGEARRQAEEAMRAESRASAVAAFLTELFEASDPDVSGRSDPTASQLLAEGARRARTAFADQPALRGELLLLLARLHLKLGQRDEAEALLQASGTQDSDDDLLAARAWLLASGIAYDRGDGAAAASAAEAAIERLPAEASPALRADARMALALGQSRSGRTQEGAASARLALAEGAADRVGEADRLALIGSALGLLAMVGAHAEAERLAAEGWALLESGVGDATAAFNLLSNHSLLLQDMGRLSEAVDLQRRALAMVEEAYPEAHRRRAGLLGNLGTRLNQLGRHEEAEAVLREALTSYARVYDRPNLHVAAVHNNFGLLLTQMDRHAEALPHLETALAVAREAFGEEDSRTLTARVNLAVSRSRMGEFEAALPEILDVLEVRRRALGDRHPHVVSGMGLVADHFLRAGEPTEALAWAERALALQRASGAPATAFTLALHTYHARALAALGRDQEADTALDEALSLMDALGKDAGNQYLRVLETYADLLAERDPGRVLHLLESARHDARFQAASGHPAALRLRSTLERIEARAAAGDEDAPP
jgi:tetratricopeptide (TPR) repeat protein